MPVPAKSGSTVPLCRKISALSRLLGTYQALSNFFLVLHGYQDPCFPFAQFKQTDVRRRASNALLEEGAARLTRSCRRSRQKLRQMNAEQARPVAQAVENSSGYIHTEGVPPDEPQAPAGAATIYDDKVWLVTVGDHSSIRRRSRPAFKVMGSPARRTCVSLVALTLAALKAVDGDTLRLDSSATPLAMRREGVKVPLDLEYSDLQVHQAEYPVVVRHCCPDAGLRPACDHWQSFYTCKSAIWRCCLIHHSIGSLQGNILFTTRPGVRLATSASASGSLLHKHTNGLILAQRLLTAEKKDAANRSRHDPPTAGSAALTLEDGRIYKSTRP